MRFPLYFEYDLHEHLDLFSILSLLYLSYAVRRIQNTPESNQGPYAAIYDSLWIKSSSGSTLIELFYWVISTQVDSSRSKHAPRFQSVAKTRCPSMSAIKYRYLLWQKIPYQVHPEEYEIDDGGHLPLKISDSIIPGHPSFLIFYNNTKRHAHLASPRSHCQRCVCNRVWQGCIDSRRGRFRNAIDLSRTINHHWLRYQYLTWFNS